MPIKIVALFGESGTGKDTIANILLAHDNDYYHKIVSHTTRPQREGEIEGFDYHYISNLEFIDLMLQDEFIEALEFNDWFYGATKSSLCSYKVNLGIFIPEGIENLFETAGAHNLQILPIRVLCSDKTRMLRALNREESPDISEICRRYQVDQEDFKDISFDYTTIGNDDKDKTNWTYYVDTVFDNCEAFFH